MIWEMIYEATSYLFFGLWVKSAGGTCAQLCMQRLQKASWTLRELLAKLFEALM